MRGWDVRYCGACLRSPVCQCASRLRKTFVTGMVRCMPGPSCATGVSGSIARTSNFPGSWSMSCSTLCGCARAIRYVGSLRICWWRSIAQAPVANWAGQPSGERLRCPLATLEGEAGIGGNTAARASATPQPGCTRGSRATRSLRWAHFSGNDDGFGSGKGLKPDDCRYNRMREYLCRFLACPSFLQQRS